MDTLGVVEMQSIASGAEVADAMVKSAEVDLLRASSICGGRFLIYVSGDLKAVETAVEHAVSSGRKLLGSFVISHVSPLLTASLKKPSPSLRGEALGVVESRIVSAGLKAADAAVKKADVRILKFVAGQGIMGKSYFVLGGDVAAVREAVQDACVVLADKLVESVVIPSPAEAVAQALSGVARSL